MAGRYVRLTVISLLAVSVDAAQIVASQQSFDQPSAVANLGSGNWQDRRAAISQLLLVPGRDLSSAAVEAVMRELDHLRASPRLGEEDLPPGSDPEAGFDYHADLIELLCRSKDSRVIPYLAGALEMGNRVSGALAEWGDAGAQAAVAAAAEHSNDPWIAATALRTLIDSVARNPALSGSVRAKVGEFARSRLRGEQATAVVELAIELSTSLRDSAAVPQLNAIRNSATASAAGLTLLDDRAGTHSRFQRVKNKADEALGRLQAVR